MAKLIAFPVKSKMPVVVPRSALDPCPIPPEVMVAMGLTEGLVLFGGPAPAKQLGRQEVRPLLKEA